MISFQKYARKSVLLLGTALISSGIFLFFSTQQPEITRIENANLEVPPIAAEMLTTNTRNMLQIPVIDINMEIGIDQNILNRGGWVQKVFQGIPQVIAIHRFGLYSLSITEKRRQTLYNADKLRPKDTVQIVWEAKIYSYRITSISTGKNNPSIKNNQLLLYTCKDWDAKERIFILLTRA